MTAATVTGRVEVRDSRDPGVRGKQDFSGVVISLERLSEPAPARATSRTARIVQKNKTFSPHILAIPTGTTVDFPNFDPIYHNAFSNYNGQLFDVGLYPPGSSRSVRFTRPGIVRIFCNIHSSMSAVLVVLDTPWFGTSARSGAFEIVNVPPGDYKLNLFHERATDAALQAAGRRITVAEPGLTIGPLAISESGYLPIPHTNKYGREYPQTDDASAYPGVRK